MPNRGSDTCLTCSFNAKNRGETGYGHRDNPEPDYCTIRAISVDSLTSLTYCMNHPFHNPRDVTTPVGPVWQTSSTMGSNLYIVADSPDSEELRCTLLSLVHDIQEQPTEEYRNMFGLCFDDAVIWQLGEFLEKRAIPDLERIALFDTKLKAIGRDNAHTVELAEEALLLLRIDLDTK